MKIKDVCLISSKNKSMLSELYLGYWNLWINTTRVICEKDE